MGAARRSADRHRAGALGRRDVRARAAALSSRDRQMTRIADTVTYLEMFERPPVRPLPAPLGKLALMRSEQCTVSFYRYLYETGGTPWVGFERRQRSEAALAAELAKPTTEVFVMYVGGVPAGYFELDSAEARQTE